MRPTSLRALLSGPDRGRGQALVEFALISVVMLTLLAAAIDLGRLFYANITIANAARTGALQAARTPDSYTTSGGTLNTCPATASAYRDNLITCAVQNETRNSFVRIDPSRIAISCEGFDGSATTCGSVPVAAVRSRVTVSATFSPLTPLIAAVTGSTITMTSSAIADQLALPTAVLPPDLTSASPTATPTPTPDPSSSPTPPPLTAEFAVTTFLRCEGKSISFTDTSSGGPTDWSWDFGDGGSSTSQDTSHTFTTAGSYSVTLTISRASDGATASATLSVSVGKPPAAAFTPASTTVPAGTTVQFTDTSVANVTVWGWNFGDSGAGNTSTAQNPSHKYTGQNKTHTVTLDVTNACGTTRATGTVTTN